MFESNMLENMQAMQDSVTLHNNDTKWNNPWLNLVTPEFKAFLDSLSTSSKEETTEIEED